MKKLIFILIIVITLFNINVYALDLDINSRNAIMYDISEDKLLYEKNSNEKVSIASLTKIMTCVVALENINNLDDTVKLTYKDFEGLLEANASQAGFKIGEVVTYRDLLYGLMLPSGADAAQALVNNISSSKDEYIKLMNDKALELKLNNTHFSNATGLDDDNNYSTVEDIYKLFKYALSNEEFKTIVTTKTYTTSDGLLTVKSTTKKFIDKFDIEVDYIKGSKTGTTDNAGFCLASFANFDNQDFILVTTGAEYSKTSPNHLYDAKKIYEYFQNNYKYQVIVPKKTKLIELDTKYAKNKTVTFYNDKDLYKYLEKDINKDDIKIKYSGVDLITLKMDKGTKLGKVDVYYKDKVIDSIDIILKEKQKLSIFRWLIGHIVYIIILLLIIVIISRRRIKIRVKKKVIK